MKRVMVRYRVKPDRADENEALVRAVYEELKHTSPSGLRYATFRLDDGVSFVHISSTETEDGHNPLSDVAAFQEFQRGIGERCEVAPVVTELHEVGSYAFFGSGWKIGCFLSSEEHGPGALVEQARRAPQPAHRLWPNEQLPGELAQVLPVPAHFEQATELVTELVTEEMIAEAVPGGPDIDRHVQALQEFADPGADELFVQQIGPEQEAFFDTWAAEVLPRFA